MDNPAFKVLVNARQLIADPDRWIQGSFAKRGDGIDISPANPSAVCWCALGALRHFSPLSEAIVDGAAVLLAKAIVKEEEMYYEGEYDFGGIRDAITEFNDFKNHATVLAAFDKAIQLSQETPPCST